MPEKDVVAICAKRNHEYYMDKTANEALENVASQDKLRLNHALAEVHEALHFYGFELVGRIALLDIKTGKIRR